MSHHHLIALLMNELLSGYCDLLTIEAALRLSADLLDSTIGCYHDITFCLNRICTFALITSVCTQSFTRRSCRRWFVLWTKFATQFVSSALPCKVSLSQMRLQRPPTRHRGRSVSATKRRFRTLLRKEPRSTRFDAFCDRNQSAV